MNRKAAVRNIRRSDCGGILKLRNAPDVRRYFRDSARVSSAEHNLWFEKQLAPPNRKRFFVAAIGQNLVGYVRYDLSGGYYDISIGVASPFRRLQIGSILLNQSLTKVEKDGKPIRAVVKKDNFASRHFFQKNGFVCRHQGPGYDYLVRKRIALLISGAGGSVFPYLFGALEKKYDLFLVDSNPAVKKIYPDKNVMTVPPVTDQSYRDTISRIIKRHKIDYYIPLIDEEIPQALSMAATRKGLRVIAPRKGFVGLCLDKYALMRQLASRQISEVKTWKVPEFKGEMFPIFVKPRVGRGSRGGRKIMSSEELSAYFRVEPYSPADVIVQEYLEGDEYTVSVVVNNQNRPMAIVPKKIILKKGITQQAVTEKNKLIEETCRKIVEKLQPAGPFNVQLRIVKGKLKIFEINPRFSTTTVLTCEAGVNEFELWIDNYDCNSVKYVDTWKEGLYLYRRWESCFYES